MYTYRRIYLCVVRAQGLYLRIALHIDIDAEHTVHLVLLGGINNGLNAPIALNHGDMAM
jgi:hypothetical protein